MKYAEIIESVLSSLGHEAEETAEGYMASCPLPEHDDSTPSWTINTGNGLWRCFGCHESGNLPILLYRLFGDSDKAQEFIDRIPWESLPNRGKGSSKRMLPESVMSSYMTCPAYMLERGFSKKFLKRFGIGYDPTDMSTVFPIRDVKGVLVGVTRRATLPHAFPKYKHSVFEKSRTLYLVHEVSRRVTSYQAAGDQLVVVICEGHIDALRLWQRAHPAVFEGKNKEELFFGGAVAIMGSAMSYHQARVLACLDIVNIALAFDHDKAGKHGEEIAAKALLAVGIRNVYRLVYQGDDPGEIAPESGLKIEGL